MRPISFAGCLPSAPGCLAYQTLKTSRDASHPELDWSFSSGFGGFWSSRVTGTGEVQRQIPAEKRTFDSSKYFFIILSSCHTLTVTSYFFFQCSSFCPNPVNSGPSSTTKFHFLDRSSRCPYASSARCSAPPGHLSRHNCSVRAAGQAPSVSEGSWGVRCMVCNMALAG